MSLPHDMLDVVSPSCSSPLFIGREADLATLEDALRTAASAEPAVVLLGGEAGVGKTRLVGEFTERAGASGALILTGRCMELGADSLPFAAFTMVLRGLVRDFGVPALTEWLPGDSGSELGRLLPELDVGRQPADAREPGQARARLFEEMLALLEHLAEDHGPVALIIEDAHWADASTRSLLSFLVANQRIIGRCLIIVTFRSDELHRTHPLRGSLAELDRVSWVRRTELPRLTRPETARLIAAIRRGEPELSLVESVFGRSEGNPLFAEELLCCDGELPWALRDLVLSSAQKLPAETQDVLRTASAVGERVGHELLKGVSGLGDAALARALRPAVAANVLIPDEDGYAFRHTLIREALHDDLLPGERTRLHARLAEVISADRGLVAVSRAAIEIAHHTYAAHDIPGALASAWQAAGEAGRALAYAEQLALLGRVLELWAKVPDARALIDTEHVDVLAEAARIAHQVGEEGRALSYASAALREVDPAAEPAKAALLLERRAQITPYTAADTSVDDLRRALELVVGDQYRRERAQVLASLAMRLSMSLDWSQARQAAEEAHALALATGDLSTQASTLITMVMINLENRPSCDDADIELLEKARALAKQAGDYHRVMGATINESHVLEGAGAHQRAAEVAKSGLAEAHAFGLSRTDGAFLAGNLAEPLISLGRWEEAIEVIERALDLGGRDATRANLRVLAGTIAVARGDFAAAEACVSAAETLLTGLGYQDQYQLPFARLTVDLRRAQGQVADALTVAQRAIESFDLQPSSRYAWPLLVGAARAGADVLARPAAAREESLAERARTVLDLVCTEAAKLVVGPAQRAHQLTVEAEVGRGARESGSPGPGTGSGPLYRAQAWQRAAAAWEELDEGYPLAQALCRAAEAALGAGERDTASANLRRAYDLASRLGAAPLAREIVVLARRSRIGLAEGSRRAESPAAHELTPREVEVLRLVAAGRTNARIADELFISAKTVSVHVSNILAKLGATTRGEAAAKAHELRLLDDLTAA